MENSNKMKIDRSIFYNHLEKKSKLKPKLSSFERATSLQAQFFSFNAKNEQKQARGNRQIWLFVVNLLNSCELNEH